MLSDIIEVFVGVAPGPLAQVRPLGVPICIMVMGTSDTICVNMEEQVAANTVSSTEAQGRVRAVVVEALKRNGMTVVEPEE